MITKIIFIIFFLSIVFMLIWAIFKETHPKWKTVYFYVLKCRNDGDDRIKIINHLIKHHNIDIFTANTAYLFAKDGNEEWFKQNIR